MIRIYFHRPECGPNHVERYNLPPVKARLVIAGLERLGIRYSVVAGLDFE